MSEASVPREAFRSSSSHSAELYARARRVLPGGNTRTTVYEHPYPPYAARGKGAVIIDVEGEERYDFLNNYTALIHGHADPDIATAVVEQLHHGVSFALPTEQEVALAETIATRVPSVEQVRFTNSGSEAVMMAIKAARAYTGRPKIAKFEGCYHGSYDFAEVSLATPQDRWDDGDPPATPYSAGTPEAVLENVVVLPYNDSAAMERLLERERHQLAAVLIDPLPSRAGLVAATGPFLQRLREITTAYGIVLIFDEVICLRVAPGGMQSVVGVTPDLTTMGKIIGGGFPVGAVGGAARVMAVFDPSGGAPKAPHGGTFNANPITMVAGQAAMRKLTPEEFGRLDTLGAALREGLAEAMDGARVLGQVTGVGSLFHVHLHQRPLHDYRSSVALPAEHARREALYRALLAHGVMTAPTLFGALSTPMGEPEINALVDAFASALRETA